MKHQAEGMSAPEQVDIGHVGEVASIDTSVLKVLENKRPDPCYRTYWVLMKKAMPTISMRICGR